jgi:hypothetical protein
MLQYLALLLSLRMLMAVSNNQSAQVKELIAVGAGAAVMVNALISAHT